MKRSCSSKKLIRLGTWVAGTLTVTAPLMGAVYHVDAAASSSASSGLSWSDAFRDLQQALSRAVAGDEIWVAEGTYHPSLNPDPGRDIGSPCSASDAQLKSYLLVSGVSVLGGFPIGGGNPAQRDPSTHPTVLSGDLSNDDLPAPEGLLHCLAENIPLQPACAMWDLDGDGQVFWTDFYAITHRGENARQVVTCWKASDRTILDGFTITGGNAVYCGNGQTGREESATSTTHSASGGNPRYNIGGGLANFQGSPVIRNCRFQDNVTGWRGGAVGSVGRSMTLVNCVFENNFANHEGGAIRQLSGGPISIINCLFLHNSASVSGGALWMENVDANVINCTLVENRAAFLTGYSGQGGGIAYSGAKRLTLANSILWNNSADGIDLDESQLFDNSGSADIVNNCIQHWQGMGFANFADDPLFTAAAAQDFRPLPNSPCIDSGDSTRVPANITTDLNGNPRLYVLLVDRGVYESQDCNGNGISDALEPDSDHDRVPDDCDVCPAGDDLADTDRDGVPDACDVCAGFDDSIDRNHDGKPDCSTVDLCPDDVEKTSPGACGCGVIDADANGDGVPDCFLIDLCPSDSKKTNPGACGCGQPDADLNHDGVPDCFSVDLCPSDPLKVTPGACGCGVADRDADGDGLPDCFKADLCPNDADKGTPGACGCGVLDVDNDHNGVPDCFTVDLCPNDPAKSSPGICGCGISDTDSDGNGIPDCLSFDLCPADPLKSSPGVCGCGELDIDANSDGIPDCLLIDLCPDDPNKTLPGLCGCGLAETSNCSASPNPSATIDESAASTTPPLEETGKPGGSGSCGQGACGAGASSALLPMVAGLIRLRRRRA